MKRVTFAGLLCFCTSLLAEAHDIQSSDSGFYIGMGAEGTYDKNEWQLNAHSLGDTAYRRVDFSKKNWSYSPLLFCGYRSCKSFLYALEVSLSLNKNKVYHTFPLSKASHPLKFPSTLRIQNGNSLSVCAKAGYAFSCYTAYVIGGAYFRKSRFNFDYLPKGEDDDEDAALRSSCSEKSKNIVRPQFGVGVSYRKDGTEIGLEYICRLRGKISLSASVDTNVIDDSADHPRHLCNENTQHCISVRISKNINWW